MSAISLEAISGRTKVILINCHNQHHQLEIANKVNGLACISPK